MVLRKSLITTIVLTALLAVAASASASFDITVEVDEQTEPIPPGGSAELTVTVLATASSDWVCPTGGSFDIELAVEGEDADVGFEGDISPSVGFDVESGVYSSASERWSGENTATFSPKINNNVERGHLEHTYTIRATFPGGTSGPSGCQEAPPSEEWSEADGSAQATIEAEAPEEEEEDDDEGDGDGDGDTQGDTEEGPAPVAGLLILTAVVTAALRRRR